MLMREEYDFLKRGETPARGLKENMVKLEFHDGNRTTPLGKKAMKEYERH